MKLEPAVYEYRDSPVYINMPFKDIRPTRSRDSWKWHPVTRDRVEPKDHQIFRIAVLEDGTVFMGEGDMIVHCYVGPIAEQLKLPATETTLIGLVYYMPDKIYIEMYCQQIFDKDKGRYRNCSEFESELALPPHWGSLLEGAEINFEWRRW